MIDPKRLIVRLPPHDAGKPVIVLIEDKLTGLRAEAQGADYEEARDAALRQLEGLLMAHESGRIGSGSNTPS